MCFHINYNANVSVRVLLSILYFIFRFHVIIKYNFNYKCVHIIASLPQAIVKVTTKLIASKLFSPRKGRMVRFDFAKALEGADTKEEQKRPKKTKPILIMTPRTIAALQEQVKTAEARLESAKQELETARRNQKKNAIRELRIATEALAIAKSLLAEAQAQEQVSDSKENSNPQQPKKAPSNCTDSVNNRLEEEPVDA
uniref:Uncharacterized protein n=1 Tax=Amorphochlora amoebiformis TaxID=1561963 RepID=A0A7S0DMV2_9EUKA|mmetsp:Transcript_32636/g.52562  ORF Transcript_32636/g.52562 Transcript_32636/m.52562 type:complete len:198 (+) Transcript_32636:1-594(+)